MRSKPAEPACPAALTGASLLQQAAGFIELLDDRAYSQQSKVMAGGTIGKHFRHSLDHFAAALSGALAGDPINYDHRRRNVPMETDRSAALAAIRRLIDQLSGTSAPLSTSSVRVRVMLAADGSEAEFASTLGRELAFAAHHAVHHHAMIKAIAEEHGVSVPTGFGMAPSTVNFQNGLAAR
jgi:hypothetical protein